MVHTVQAPSSTKRMPQDRAASRNGQTRSAARRMAGRKIHCRCSITTPQHYSHLGSPHWAALASWVARSAPPARVFSVFKAPRRRCTCDGKRRPLLTTLSLTCWKTVISISSGRTKENRGSFASQSPAPQNWNNVITNTARSYCVNNNWPFLIHTKFLSCIILPRHVVRLHYTLLGRKSIFFHS